MVTFTEENSKAKTSLFSALLRYFYIFFSSSSLLSFHVTFAKNANVVLFIRIRIFVPIFILPFYRLPPPPPPSPPYSSLLCTIIRTDGTQSLFVQKWNEPRAHTHTIHHCDSHRDSFGVWFNAKWKGIYFSTLYAVPLFIRNGIVSHPRILLVYNSHPKSFMNFYLRSVFIAHNKCKWLHCYLFWCLIGDEHTGGRQKKNFLPLNDKFPS